MPCTSTVSETEAAVCVCGTVYHRSCNGTWAKNSLSEYQKHFCLTVCWLRHIVTAYLHLRNTLMTKLTDTWSCQIHHVSMPKASLNSNILTVCSTQTSNIKASDTETAVCIRNETCVTVTPEPSVFWLLSVFWLPSVHWYCWLGIKKSMQPVKNWVMRYWHGYLSGARCKCYAYGPADANATPSSLASLKSRLV